MFTKVYESSNGFGLGLHIVQLALKKLNGSIKLESKEGEGTLFIIRIPYQEQKVEAGKSIVILNNKRLKGI